MEAINWHSFFFLIFAVAACASAVAVVVTGNIVRMAGCLIASLGAVAGLFFLAGADFLGAVQLMVYVGGTMVLLVFGVMLTARGPFVSMRTGGGQWVLAIIVSFALLAMLMQTALSVGAWRTRESATAAKIPSASATSAPLGLALLGVRVDQLEKTNLSARRGMSGYLLPFEIISVHLLVALIGAAYLARTKRQKEPQ
ncbi:MAG: NADH-quinone oxidoreductase subunit J family protein [Thermoguttaceae bacterium]